MQRDEQHIVAIIKDALRTVAVVVIDVQDRDPGGTLIAEHLGRDRGVVQIAIAPRQIA